MNVTFQENGRCRVFDNHGDVVNEFDTDWKPAYNRQYDTPVSVEHNLLFVPSWEKGVSAYDLRDGSMAWRKGPGKVRQMVVSGGLLVSGIFGRGIIVRDMVSGNPEHEMKMTSVEDVFYLGDGLALIGPRRSSFYVVSLPELNIVQEVDRRILNPDRCLSHILNNVWVNDRSLVISGWEEFPDMDHTVSGRRDFRRCIPLLPTAQQIAGGNE